MTNFNIGDRVEDFEGNVGVITDKLASAKRGVLYLVQMDDTEEEVMFEESGLELYEEISYATETEILDNVVIGYVYEVRGDKRTEVSRGHGHITHNGAVGIAQAVSYSFKKAFLNLSGGDYMLKKRGG